MAMAVKSNSYPEIPFSSETRHDEFYTYVDLRDIRSKCEHQRDSMVKCRTLGILRSVDGRFFLTDFNIDGTDSELFVQVSVVYLQQPLQCTILPYPVQIFGTLQWRNRPIIFAKLLQVMSVSNAIRLKKTLNSISSTHIAKYTRRDQEDLEDLT